MNTFIHPTFLINKNSMWIFQSALLKIRAGILLLVFLSCNAVNNCFSDIKLVVALPELPVLSRPPYVAEEGPGANDITIKWLPWNRQRGDKGDPPILWYNIYLRDIKGSSERKVGIATHLNCGHECNYTIDELRPNTEYAVRVSTQRIGQGGEGEPGPTLYTSTDCTGSYIMVTAKYYFINPIPLTINNLINVWSILVFSIIQE